MNALLIVTIEAIERKVRFLQNMQDGEMSWHGGVMTARALREYYAELAELADFAA